MSRAARSPKSKTLAFSVTIDDCEVDTFTVGGHGGSGKDTSNTGVRIRHLDSGAVGRCVDGRSQLKNKRTAFRRMAESKEFQAWAKRTALQRQDLQSIERRVEEAMSPKNLKVESHDGVRWNPYDFTET